jgi:hypothetical protein
MPIYSPAVRGMPPSPSTRITDPFVHNKVDVLQTFRIANSEPSLPDPADYSTYDIIRLDDGQTYIRTSDVTWEIWPAAAGLMQSPAETDPTDPEIGTIYYNTVVEYYRFWDGVRWQPASFHYAYAEGRGVDNAIHDIILPKFIPGYTELFVLGKRGWWIPKFPGSVLYMFEEVKDGLDEYTIVRPRETVGIGPYAVKYIRDL